MEKKVARHKALRRKYKHFAVALAGAAIMAGSTLHGIPFAKAAAAEDASTSSPVATEQTTLIHKPVKELIDDADVTVTDPSVAPEQSEKFDNNTVVAPDQRDKNKDDWDRGGGRGQRDDRNRHDRYDHEKWADRRETFAHRMEWYNDSLNKIQIYNNNENAVDIVMAAAADLGFDVNNDSFTLISQEGSQSVVNVVHDGNKFTVTVNRLARDKWMVSSVNPV